MEGSPPSPVFLLLSVALEHPALHHLHTLRWHALLRHCTAPEPDRQRGGALCGGTVQPHTPARWFFLRRQHRPAPPGADQQGCGGVRWRGNPPRGSERTCGLLVLWCWWHGMAWHGTRPALGTLLHCCWAIHARASHAGAIKLHCPWAMAVARAAAAEDRERRPEQKAQKQRRERQMHAQTDKQRAAEHGARIDQGLLSMGRLLRLAVEQNRRSSDPGR
eukprot:COSAG01_NODE_559_length_15469_cov_11.071308_10_plen_219_part_00